MSRLSNLIFITALLMHFPNNALASEHGQRINLYKTADQQSGISQRKAIAIAQRHIKGRVLDIKQLDGIYRIKILSEQGLIHVVQVGVVDGEIKVGH